MTWIDIVRAFDLLASAFVFGATVWFFFVQSPVLLRSMGREKFVSLQMRLTRVLFNVLALALGAMMAATLLRASGECPAILTGGVALFGGLVNKFVVVPRALRAGGASRRDIVGRDHEGDTVGFASVGAGAKTKVMHRLVVLFVVVMLGGVVTHVLDAVAG